MKKRIKVYKKLHKWPGLIVAFIVLYYGITGIIMNHREFFSGVDINRQFMPSEFHYVNWNNSALKGNLIINRDSILVYGNIGIWVTDSEFSEYRSLNKGFEGGADNRKIFDLHRADDGNLYAAAQFGLFAFDNELNQWQKFPLDVDIKRFVAVESVDDTLYILNRSYLFKGKSEGIETIFEKIELPQPANYKNDISLFETIWQIHSGEIFGIPGKLFVDFLGIVTIFFSVTGIIYFLFPGWIKERKRKKKKAKKIISINKWSLKWHNKTGAWAFAFVVVLFLTGIFLRPPLLISIAKSKVKPVKFSHLDQPNPWHDKLRDLLYDCENGIFLLSTSEGIYYMKPGKLLPVKFEIQPPVSVMGINTLERFEERTYMVGSFSGLFLWNPFNPHIFNLAKGRIHEGASSGRPVGDFKITGTISDYMGDMYMVDYDNGIIPLHHEKQFPGMPVNILEDSKMSLWNFSLELHTGRLFKSLVGDFYILIVPLSGLTGIIVVLSGYLLWRKRNRKKIG